MPVTLGALRMLCAVPEPTATPGRTASLYPASVTRRRSAACSTNLLAPLNVLAVRGGLAVPELERLGVARLSLGSEPWRAALAAFRHIAREVLDHGTYHSMTDNTFTYDEMQQLLRGGSSG